MEVSDTPPQRRPGGRIIRLLIGSLLVVAIAWYLFHHRQDLVHLQGIPPLVLALLVVARVVALAILLQASQRLLCVFSPALGFAEYLLLVAGGSVADHFVPFGGLSSKALYLHHRHHISPGQLVSAMVYQGIIRFLLCGVISAISLAALTMFLGDGIGQHVGSLQWLATSLSLLVGLGALLLLGPLGRVGRKLRPLARLADGWRTLTSTRNMAPAVTLLTFVSVLIQAAALGMLWVTMVPSSPFVVGALLSLLVVPLRVVRITPGNLGAQEGAIGLLAWSFGVPVSVGAVVSVVSRLIGVAALALLALLAAGSRHIRRPQAGDAGMSSESGGAETEEKDGRTS